MQRHRPFLCPLRDRMGRLALGLLFSRALSSSGAVTFAGRPCVVKSAFGGCGVGISLRHRPCSGSRKVQKAWHAVCYTRRIAPLPSSLPRCASLLRTEFPATLRYRVSLPHAARSCHVICSSASCAVRAAPASTFPPATAVLLRRSLSPHGSCLPPSPPTVPCCACIAPQGSGASSGRFAQWVFGRPFASESLSQFCSLSIAVSHSCL